MYKYAIPGLIILFIAACAQQGSLTGGAKDEKPPEIVVSVPPNFTTHFKSDRVEITFNEYIALKEITKQLVVSPPMTKKPEIKAKGKSLEIIFKDSLQPDRTYAINFGDAIVDLNESNPLKNFQFVFSTGSTIDSLQASGRVVMALDGKPAEDIQVMLYSGSADSLPLKTIPLYISRTDKEGRFTLRNLAEGSYKIFALKDGNSNFMFDLVTESVGFQDSLIRPTIVENAVVDSVKNGENVKIDSVKTDTVKNVKIDSVRVVNLEFDSLKFDSLEVVKPIELRLFTEVRPNQYLSGSDRLRKDQIRLKFNEKLDSLQFEFLDLPMDSVAVALEWTGDADTVDFWIMNPALAARDSMTAILQYPGYDSIEQPAVKIDTVKLRYRAAAKPAGAAKNEFAVSLSIDKSKILEYGQQVVVTTSLPWVKMDTSLIRLVSGRDSVGRPVPWQLVPDTIKGLVMNGMPVNQVHPRVLRLQAPMVADTSYRLVMLPGAFQGFGTLKNDTLDIRFKMKKRDEYGTVKIELPNLKGAGIVELLDSRGKTVSSRTIKGPGTVVFELMAPGVYSAKLIFDANGNGKWDTGRYIRHIQPEKVISLGKELNLKANWEVSESWKWEDL